MLRWAVRWYCSVTLLFTLWDAWIDGNHSLLIDHTTHSIMHRVFHFCVDLESWNMILEFSHSPFRFVCLQTAVISSFSWLFYFTSLLVSSYNNCNVISTFKVVLCYVCPFHHGWFGFHSSEHVVPFHSYCSHCLSFSVI